MARRAKRMRRRTGVVMAAADLMITIPVMIVGIFCLLDAGMASCYKQKIQLVLAEAAHFAVNLPDDSDLQKPTAKLVEKLLKASALDYVSLSTTVKKIDVEGEDAVSVTSVVGCPLLKGSCLPISISMQDTCIALIPANRITAMIAINPFPYSAQAPNGNESVYVPIIRPRRPVPIWVFPYDQAINGLHVDQLPDGTAANTKSSDCKVYFSKRPSLY